MIIDEILGAILRYDGFQTYISVEIEKYSVRAVLKLTQRHMRAVIIRSGNVVSSSSVADIL